MALNKRRIVIQLSKIWEQVITKGKFQGQNILRHPSQVQDKISKAPFRVKLPSLTSAFEDFSGISEIKNAHSNVLYTEKKFMESQEERRKAQSNMAEIQMQLRTLRLEIDRTARGDNSYLDLIKQEISLVQDEQILRTHFNELEKREQDLFSDLSNCLRLCHEKEQFRHEKTKYWSVGSFVGAFLCILGTAALNFRQDSSKPDEIDYLSRNLEPIDKQNFEHHIKTIFKDTITQLDLDHRILEHRLQKKTDHILATTKTVESALNKLLLRLAYLEETDQQGIKSPGLIPSEEFDKAFKKHNPPMDRDKWIATVGILLLGVLSYYY